LPMARATSPRRFRERKPAMRHSSRSAKAYLGLPLLILLSGCGSDQPDTGVDAIAGGDGNIAGASGAGGGGSGGRLGSGGAAGVAGAFGSGGLFGLGGAGTDLGGSSNGGEASTMGGVAGQGGNPATGGNPASGGGSAEVGGNSPRGGRAGTSDGGALQGGAAGGPELAGGSPGAGGAAQGGATGEPTSIGGGPGTEADLAFPEAEGFGRHARGGRDGTVVHVTNLDDSGAGSFRDAVSSSNRIVVFDVGGYIRLQTAVSVKSDITIAGQTAPGEGIGFQGGEISFANSSSIICRYIRIRPGDETESDTDDALSLYRAKNVIVDHSSMEFGPWNNIDGVSDDWQNYPVTDITFQDNLIADPTYQQFGAHAESVASDWSWFRNIFANSHNRNPLAKVNDIFVNNVLYNYSAGYTTHTSTAFSHDIINNYFIFGPASTGTDNTWFQVDQNQSIYYSGNLKDNNLNGTLDGAGTTPYWYQGEGTVLSAPWSDLTSTLSIHNTQSGYRISVSMAGTLPRDELDTLIISQIKTLGQGTIGTGANTTGPDGNLYTSQTQTGLSNNGYGTIQGGTRAPDSDDDGMPDYWEQATGSDPSSDDAMQMANDGYALIEHYINWLAVPHARTTVDTPVDVDLSSYSLGFSEVSPTFSVSAAANGSVQLLSDGHTAEFTPGAGLYGLAAFDFEVTGSDDSSYQTRVVVLLEP